MTVAKEDWDALAAKLIDPSTPTPARDLAAKRLLEKLQKIAARQCARLGLRRDHQWADEAASDAYAQCFYDNDPNRRYDPSRGRFVPFATRIIHNSIVDRLRKHRKRREAGEKITKQTQTEPTEEEVAPPGWFFVTPFSDAELRTMERDWQPPRDRVIVVVCFGLHNKVPSATWSRWLAQAEIDPPFPPPELDISGPEHGIQTRIAEHLEINPATVAQVIRRKGKTWLKSLPSIKNL